MGRVGHLLSGEWPQTLLRGKRPQPHVHGYWPPTLDLDRQNGLNYWWGNMTSNPLTGKTTPCDPKSRHYRDGGKLASNRRIGKFLKMDLWIRPKSLVQQHELNPFTARSPLIKVNGHNPLTETTTQIHSRQNVPHKYIHDRMA